MSRVEKFRSVTHNAWVQEVRMTCGYRVRDTLGFLFDVSLQSFTIPPFPSLVEYGRSPFSKSD